MGIVLGKLTCNDGLFHIVSIYVQDTTCLGSAKPRLRLPLILHVLQKSLN